MVVFSSPFVSEAISSFTHGGAVLAMAACASSKDSWQNNWGVRCSTFSHACFAEMCGAKLEQLAALKHQPC